MRTSTATPTSDLVPVFDRDPSLLGDLDPATAAALREHGVAPSVRVTEGPWHPPSHGTGARHWLGLLILEGYVGRQTTIGVRTVTELLGPGDVVRPWDRGDERLVRGRTPWYALAPTCIAVLDSGFTEVAGGSPAVVAELSRRLLRRSTSLAAAVEIADRTAGPDRVLCLLEHVAGRWGERDDDGVVLPPFLIDAAVAVILGEDLVAAAGALARLAETGRAVRRADGRLVLRDA